MHTQMLYENAERGGEIVEHKHSQIDHVRSNPGHTMGRMQRERNRECKEDGDLKARRIRSQKLKWLYKARMQRVSNRECAKEDDEEDEEEVDDSRAGDCDCTFAR